MLERLLPVAASAHAAELDSVLASVHLHIAIQAVAWGAFLVICLVRFRRGAQPRASHAGLRPALPLFAIGVVVVGDAVLLATTALPAWLARTTPPASIPPRRSKCASSPSSSPGTSTTRDLTADSAHTAPALIGASNPVGIDRAPMPARDDIGLLIS